MKKLCYLVAVLVINACTGNPSQQAQLEAENDSLKNRIARLEHLEAIHETLKRGPQVAIANTSVEYLQSEYVDQNFQIKMSYPKNYHKNTSKTYPVLYIIDAETNFGGVSYVVQRLIKDRLIPEILVVGIAYDTDYKNFYSLRSRDLTPVRDDNVRMGGHRNDPTGGAPQFSDFLEFELIPHIESSYRVKKGDRGIYGHSYGGLYGSYAVVDKPHLFNRYLLLGPSLWFKDKIIVNELPGKTPTYNQPTRLYMGSGELDLRIQEFQEEFVAILREKNLPNLSIKSEVMDNETHRTIFGAGFMNGLRFIYEE